MCGRDPGPVDLSISMCRDTVIMTLSFMTLHKGCAVLTDGFVDFPMSHMGRCGRQNWFSHSLRSYTTDTGEKQGRFPTRGVGGGRRPQRKWHTQQTVVCLAAGALYPLMGSSTLSMLVIC